MGTVEEQDQVVTEEEEIVAPQPGEQETPPEPPAEAPADDGEPEGEDILDLKRKLKAAEREADRHRSQAEYWRSAFQGAKTAPAEKEDPEPKIEDYLGRNDGTDPYAAYSKDVANWAVRQAEKKRVEAQASEARSVEAQQFSAVASAQIEKGREKFADFDQVTAASAKFITDEIRREVLQSDFFPDIAYELGKNLELAEQLSRLKGDDLKRALFRMEGWFERAEAQPAAPTVTARQVSRAPGPLKTVGSRHVSAKNPAEMGMSELEGHFRKTKVL